MISLATTPCANAESDKLSRVPRGSFMVNKLKEKSIVKVITEHRLQLPKGVAWLRLSPYDTSVIKYQEMVSGMI